LGERVGERAPGRTGEEEGQRELKRRGSADEIGEATDDRYRHDVGQQIGVDDPNVAVDIGGVDPKIEDHPGENGRDHGEIDRAEKDRGERGPHRPTAGNRAPAACVHEATLVWASSSIMPAVRP
jgi:hypothetical protein